MAITSNSPTSSGGPVVSYAVSPALPAGLSLNATTGVITGTPTAIAATASYLVTASNKGGSTATTLTITVNDAAPTGLTYTASTAVYTRGVAITVNSPSSSGGAVTLYSVSPALPTGLSLSTTTGVITGTPTELAAEAVYTVTASNTGGSTATFLAITVNDAAPTGLTYTTSTAVYINGVAIAVNSPSSSGGAVTSYAVTPALPTGLSLSTTTGVITGTPTVISATASYLVTASNTGGSTATILTITVSTLAEQSRAVVSGELATSTPFARHLLVSGSGFTQLQSATFDIAPQPGAVSRPVSVTYRLPYLLRRNLIVSDSQLKVLVFGLYAGTTNLTLVTLTYTDGSVRTLWTSLTADPYVDPTGIYTSPTFKTARQAGDGLGFDYFWIKSGFGPPVLMDSDGKVRWTAPGNGSAFSSMFFESGFFVGNGAANLTRIEFDGTASTVPVNESRYSNFHHDMAPGKTGLLAMMDGISTTGAVHIETILAELSTTGEVMKEWDLTDIFRQEMTAAGDDPANFVRDGVDWFHMNSAVYLPEDDSLLVSSRENFVVKLDYTSGTIKWVFGDPTKHWYVNYPSLRRLAITLPVGLYPIGQHAVSAPATGELLLFNNGRASNNNPPGTPAGQDRTYSAVSRYRIDDTLLSAEQTWSYDAGESILSMYCSSAYQAQPNQYFISYAMAYGTTAKLVGLLPNGAAGFDFEFPADFCKTSWNALPIALDHLVLQ